MNNSKADTLGRNINLTTKDRLVFRGILVVLLSTQALLLAYLSWATSPNRTEVGHIGAAVYFWHTGKFDVFHVNPPLTRIIAGMPIALFCKPNYDWKSYSPRPQDRCEWALGAAFINANDLDDIRLYVFLMRAACIPLVLLGGYFGYRFAAELYCEWSGVVFLFLWTFSPLVLGWGATICPDVAAASLGIVGIYTFWHWLKKPDWRKAITAGVCLGLMPLTKMTWVIAFPLWCLLFIIWKFWRKQDEQRLPVKQFVSLLLIAVYVINSGYFYDGSFKLLKDYQFISGTLTGQEMAKGKQVKPGNRFADSWLGNIPIPLPAEFVQGIDTQKLDFERGIESYAYGTWSDHGWWWYYGYVLLLREPLGIWVLGLLALGSLYFLRKGRGTFRDELTIVLMGLLVFTFISSQTGFSIHPRYIIIALPFAYIFIGRLVQSKKRLNVIVTVACLLWVAVSSVSFYPHSMSYFNELAGKPKNYPRYLLGSNIDWGQNAYFLKVWAEKNSEARPLYITYSSPIPLEKIGIKSDGEVPTEPTKGWIAIGVNELSDKNGKFDWLKGKEVKMVGYSIWIVEINGHKTLP